MKKGQILSHSLETGSILFSTETIGSQMQGKFTLSLDVNVAMWLNKISDIIVVRTSKNKSLLSL